MDFGMTIITIIILLTCIIPFVIVSRNSSKRKKQMLQSLSAAAAKMNAKIAHYDTWHQAAIGINESEDMIFFTKKVDGKEIRLQVDLDDIQKCRVVNTNRTVNNRDSSVSVIDKLELAFTDEDRSRPEILLEFFNANTNSSGLSRELQLVDKWCALANEKIRAKSLQR